MRLRFALAAGAVFCVLQAQAQPYDFAKRGAMIQDIQRLQQQGRWDEAEELARQYDAMGGGGLKVMSDNVAMLRKQLEAKPGASTDPPPPDPLFLEPASLYDWSSAAWMAHVQPSQRGGEIGSIVALNERALALHKSGDLQGAIALYEQVAQALRAAAAQGGTMATAYQTQLPTVTSNLGLAYWQQGDLRKAQDAFRRALQERAPFDGQGYFTESAMLGKAKSDAQEVHPILSLERELGPAADALGLQLLLERKGIVLERQAGALAGFRRQAAGEAGLASMALTPDSMKQERMASDRKLLAEYEQASRDRAELAARPATSAAEQAERTRRIADLDRRMAGMQQTMQIERTVQDSPAVQGGFFGNLRRAFSDPAKTVAEDEQQRQQKVRATRAGLLQAVRERLGPDAVLLEMAKYRAFDPRRPQAARWGGERYGAYVVSRQGDPVYVDLGDAAAVDGLVQEFRRALAQRSPRAKDLGRRLDEALLRPVRERIGAATTLHVAPEGGLNLVPFAALVDEGGRYLVERYTFNYLGSGRDLLQQGRGSEPRNQPLIVADPAFAPAGAAVASAGSRSVDFRRVAFSPLPGTAAEAQALRRLLPDAIGLTGAQATETAIKRVAGPRILHIATHGFFLDDEPAGSAADARGLGRVQATAAAPAAGRPAENPMLRSGLVFAGVNGLRSGEDDGVLTALEAAALDLRGTRLVVLSACETGVGEVRNGEGVFGLRRAFAMAGAETLVMSLWQVADDATSELMVRYYGELAKGTPRAQALREAQLQLLKQRGTESPYFWAAFISSGEAGVLR